MRGLVFLALVGIVGCPPSDTENGETTSGGEGETVVVVEQVDDDDTAASGTECNAASDCADGQMCIGPEGCDVPWTCQPMRACTHDLREYCGCDGESFSGSGSCPSRPYASRGPC